MAPDISRPQPPRVETNDSRLEPENNACVVPEVALIVVAPGKAVAEASQKKIKLRRPNGDGFSQWDVDSSTNDEIPCIVARVGGSRASSLASLEKILITV